MINLILSKNKKNGILETSKEKLDLIRNFFSIKNPASKSRLPFIQDRLYSITPSGKFDIGLTPLIENFLKEKKFIFFTDKHLAEIVNPGKNISTLTELNMPLRGYQEKAILKAINQGCGIIILPTAAGKTLTAATLIKNLSPLLSCSKNCKTLVIVPTIQLVEQTAQDFLDYGLVNVSKWSGSSELNKSADIVVAGSQKLLSEKTDKSFLMQFDIVIIDEAHTLRRGNQLNKIFNFTNTPHKFGFTGTMPPSIIDQWNVIGKIGNVLYEEKTVDLKNQKFISDFKILILKIKHTDFILNKNHLGPTDAYNAEIDFLIANERRNSLISKLAINLNSNTIIMVDRIHHGELIFEKIKSLNIDNLPIYFIQGSTNLDEREYIRNLMNQNQKTIVIAISKIFSTGINIPSIQNIIFALTGKAKIKIMQSIGRALRLHPLKNRATIFDVADNLKYSKLHLEERIKLYESENYFYEKKEI